MPNPALTARIKEFLDRQIASFELMVSELQAFERKLDDPDIGHLERQRRGHVDTTEAFAKEFHALLREWQSARDLSDAERSQARGLGQKAAELAERLTALNQSASNQVRERLDLLTDTWNELRRGREMLQKYRPSAANQATFMDKRV